MPLIVIPLRISFQDWVGSLSRSIPSLLLPTVDVSEETWKEWAKLFIQLNNLHIPYPANNLYKGKDGWREWALLSLPVLESL